VSQALAHKQADAERAVEQLHASRVPMRASFMALASLMGVERSHLPPCFLIELPEPIVGGLTGYCECTVEDTRAEAQVCIQFSEQVSESKQWLTPEELTAAKASQLRMTAVAEVKRSTEELATLSAASDKLVSLQRKKYIAALHPDRAEGEDAEKIYAKFTQAFDLLKGADARHAYFSALLSAAAGGNRDTRAERVMDAESQWLARHRGEAAPLAPKHMAITDHGCRRPRKAPTSYAEVVSW